MNRKFVLRVWYGTGSAAMVVDTPVLTEAIGIFYREYSKGIPDTKCYGLPEITKAELIPLMYESVYQTGE